MFRDINREYEGVGVSDEDAKNRITGLFYAKNK